MSKMIIRVQSPDGTKRVELLPNKDTFYTLFEKTLAQFGIDLGSKSQWNLYYDPGSLRAISYSKSTLVSSNLKHGDSIYLSPVKIMDSDQMMFDESISPVSSLEVDDVDLELAKQNGQIIRSKDEQMCSHGPQGKCINCIPIEPFDLEYLGTRDPPIKYMSFHAYIKKLQSGGDKGKYTNLEKLNCKIKPGCKEHPPWPRGICNKCTPPTVYLNRQPYRHVDNLMFENPQIVERFLDFWRKSGCQRAGLLFGRYEAYDGVPLGIKATVSAIYEPPQENYDSRIELHLPDPNENKIKSLAKKFGLKCIGWIFTDLVPDESGKGPVKHFRGSAKSYYLSAEECITAAYFQERHPNPTKFSSDGYFGSKFVTVVVTGDTNNQIHFEGYQVSNQCTSLARDGCIVPTYDSLELAYIRESSNEKYIPDVYFREKDKYNNEVTKIGRPLPVEYLIIDLPAAFAKEPIYTFNQNSSKFSKSTFPIENRNNFGEVQDFSSLHNYLKLFPTHRFLDAVSDFHLLTFLITNPTVSFDRALDDLAEAIKTNNPTKATEWSRTPEWLTIEQFFQGGSVISGEEWSCSMCTFHNEASARVCGICQTPKK